MKIRLCRYFLPAALILLLPLHSLADATLSLYGTFNSMGVIVDIDSTDDPDQDATVDLVYKTASGSAYRNGFPLSRVSVERFVGSLFSLEPGITYNVRITITDPDGGLIHGVIKEASNSTRPEIITPAPSASYYASPDGTGSACTEINPCSLSQAIQRVQQGEEVVLSGGVYYVGGFAIPRSGTEEAPIVIRGKSGETAILDGSDPSQFTWTHQGGGVYRTTLNVEEPHVVMAKGKRLFPYPGLTELNGLTIEVPGFYTSGNSLYVRLESNADPNEAVMNISRFNNALYLSGRAHIRISNITFRYYGQGSYAKAIYIDTSSDIIVEKCLFSSNDLGIGIKRESHRNVIQDNEFKDTIFDWPWDVIKSSGGLEDGGVTFYDPSTGRGNIIRRNLFHDDFDGFGTCPEETAAEPTNETDVYENVVYNMGDDGVSTDGRCSNLRLWGNRFYDVLIGISMAPVYDGPVYAIRNTIYRTGVGNNNYPGSSFKFNSGYSESGPIYLFHNTSDAYYPENSGIHIKSPGTWKNIYSRNNIWSGTDYAINNNNAGQPLDFDYDLLYTIMANELVYWGDGPDRHMRDLATFRNLTGQELNGFSYAPGFTDPASGDYTLSSGSPLIDKGLIIPGINDGYAGTAPDTGAFENRDNQVQTGDGHDITPVIMLLLDN